MVGGLTAHRLARAATYHRQVSPTSPAEVDALLAPPPELLGDPVLVAADEVAATWALDAEDVDRDGLDRARVDLAGRAGLLSLTAPVVHGGGGRDAVTARAVTELLAGACGTTWFLSLIHI